MEDQTNPWVRADIERFNVETLALVREGDQEEYIRLMKQRAHVKGIAALALEQVYLSDEACTAFFEPYIPGGRHGTKEAPLDGEPLERVERIVPTTLASTPDYNTEQP